MSKQHRSERPGQCLPDATLLLTKYSGEDGKVATSESVRSPARNEHLYFCTILATLPIIATQANLLTLQHRKADTTTASPRQARDDGRLGHSAHGHACCKPIFDKIMA